MMNMINDHDDYDDHEYNHNYKDDLLQKMEGFVCQTIFITGGQTLLMLIEVFSMSTSDGGLLFCLIIALVCLLVCLCICCVSLFAY